MTQRRPRERDEKHCDFIRQLPCCLCGDNISTECAHVRMGDRTVAKPMTGIATKCDDRFTVPLCGTHHQDQHNTGNEHRWWLSKGIDPIKTALALYSVSGDHQRGEAIVSVCCEKAAA